MCQVHTKTANCAGVHMRPAVCAAAPPFRQPKAGANSGGEGRGRLRRKGTEGRGRSKTRGGGSDRSVLIILSAVVVVVLLTTTTTKRRRRCGNPLAARWFGGPPRGRAKGVTRGAVLLFKRGARAHFPPRARRESHTARKETRQERASGFCCCHTGRGPRDRRAGGDSRDRAAALRPLVGPGGRGQEGGRRESCTRGAVQMKFKVKRKRGRGGGRDN